MTDGFTSSEDLIRHGADYVRVTAKDIQRIVTLRTSGSTGGAKRLYFSAGDLRRTVDFFRDGMSHITVPGGKCAILLGSKSPDGLGRLLEQGLAELGCRPLLYGIPSSYSDAAAFLHKEHPDTIIGLPVQLRRLAITVPELRPKSVLMSGDRAAHCMKETVARLWRTTVYDHYGMTESGLGFAVQCPFRQGLHIRSDELSVEIIDPKTGAVLPDGEWGEIVFTTLRREAMPLYRYRTGDISRLIPGRCPCGQEGQRLDSIRGRISELEKPVSIYTLDELLFSSDSVWDFEAALFDTCMYITVDGTETAASLVKMLLSVRFPNLGFRIQTASIPPHSEKRSMIILPEKKPEF